MSTHNIGFFMKIWHKLSLNYHQISSNTHLISSAVILSHKGHYNTMTKKLLELTR